MNRLLEFYMTLTDEETFFTMLLETSESTVYPSYFPNKGFCELSIDRLQDTTSREYSMLSIINPSIAPKLVFDSSGSGRSSIDLTNSEVISWCRWKIKTSDGKKDPGTLWFDTSDDQCKRKKNRIHNVGGSNYEDGKEILPSIR